MYEEAYFDTKIRYEYPIYKVLDQDIKILQISDNPFATVVETVLIALKKKKLDDLKLVSLKIDLAKRLYKKGFPKQKIAALITFIAHYIRFSDSRTNSIFEKELENINKKTYPMGVQEILLHQAKTEGLEQGLEQGLELSNKRSISKMLKKGNSLAEIADFLDISTNEVIEIINKYKLNTTN